MKKVFWSFLFIVMNASIVGAATQEDFNTNRGPNTFTFKNPLNAQSFTQLADNIVNFLLTIAVPIVIIMVIWAGLLFMTAGGNTDRIQQGKDTLLWTAIGIGVLMISKSVTYLLGSILGG